MFNFFPTKINQIELKSFCHIFTNIAKSYDSNKQEKHANFLMQGRLFTLGIVWRLVVTGPWLASLSDLHNLPTPVSYLTVPTNLGPFHPPFTPNPTPQLGVPPLLPTLSPFTYQYLVLLGTRQLFSALLNMHSSRFHISFYTVCNQSTETTQRGQNNSQCHIAPIERLMFNLNGDKRACLLINVSPSIRRHYISYTILYIYCCNHITFAYTI